MGQATAAGPTHTGEALAPVVAEGAERVEHSDWRKEFAFPGVLAQVPEHCEQVMEFVNAHCPDEEKKIDLLVAVQEALANAALHGCHDDASKTIRCVVSANAEEITISVRDPGRGFPLEKADPANYQVTKLSHGRGICLIRSLVDEVSFVHNGAEIILRKRVG
jgi:anti-sigma regulatory factor (Ser/Thr protein kinase)